MRVATWNVNSVKQRVPRLLPWLDERKPDVVCLQETKLTDAAFAELLDEELTARQRQVFVAIVLNGVPLDALTVELGCNRNAIYKTLFDARRKLRTALAANGYIGDDAERSS